MCVCVCVCEIDHVSVCVCAVKVNGRNECNFRCLGRLKILFPSRQRPWQTLRKRNDDFLAPSLLIENHLADAMFGKNKVWPTQCLASTMFDQDNIWQMHGLADTMSRRHDVLLTQCLANMLFQQHNVQLTQCYGQPHYLFNT